LIFVSFHQGKEKGKLELLLFILLSFVSAFFSSSFFLIKKEAKTCLPAGRNQGKTNAPPFCRAPDSYRGHGNSKPFINSAQNDSVL